MKKIFLLILLLVTTITYSQNEILNSAINELQNLKISKLQDPKSENIIKKIKISIAFMSGLRSEGQFEIEVIDSEEIIIEKNIGLLLNEQKNGFILILPSKLLTQEYYDLLLVSIVRNAVELHDIYNIPNYYNIVNQNTLEQYLYDMDYMLYEYIFLNEYIKDKYPITTKWCLDIINSQNNNNLRDLSKGLYYVDNKIVYKIYGYFKEYIKHGKVDTLDEIIAFMTIYHLKTDFDSIEDQINLNSISFIINYLNFLEVAIKKTIPENDDGSRTIALNVIEPHSSRIEEIRRIRNEITKKINMELYKKEYLRFRNEELTQ